MATPTQSEINRLRRQLELDSTDLPDVAIADMYDEAEEQYPSSTYSRNVWFAAVRLQAAREQMAKAAKRTTYKQGQSSDNQSDLIKNWEKMIKIYSAQLGEVLDDENPTLPAVRWGVPKKTPTREQEWPNA